MGVTLSAEPPAWLDNWYEIEVIIFIQPDAQTQEVERSTPRVYTENLVVSAPKVVENVKHAFPLTEAERARLRGLSSSIDLVTGDDAWFVAPDLVNTDQAIKRTKTEVPVYGTFPDWMLPPGESYDPLFTNVFRVVPFGDWFSFLSLASLVEREDEENEEHVEDSLNPNDRSVEEAIESPDEFGIRRDGILEQIDGYREELERSSYIMDEQNVRLPRTAARLRAKGVHVIKHFNWHQFVPSLSAKPEYVFFQSLEQYPTEGYLGVSKGRFIHFDLHMWIHQPNDASGVPNPVYEMVELRRMQSEDVHYFDHPRFGILAEVAKIELPPDLQALWDSLD